ncbi:MAG: hypothetical protein JXB05_11505 [Myxococcaceae bacterium]|nr:hypothetical protein [Myxococcaceae bacterium]
MKPFSRGPRRLLQAVSLLTLVGAAQAGAEPPTAAPSTPPPPAVPFDARVARDTVLFRKAKPGDDDVAPLSTGHILTVIKLEPAQTWGGETSPVGAVQPNAQSTFYTLLSRLEPLRPGQVVSAAEATALLSKQLPADGRSWCQRFTERMLLPASSGVGKAGALIYSSSSDDACHGYMALVSGTGKAAKARALPRRGPIESIIVHEVPGGGPPLLSVVEALRGAGISGSRRTLFSLSRGTPRELLAVEVATDKLEKDTRHSVASTVTFNPSGNGLDIEVRRTEMKVTLATGAESNKTETVKRYRYEGGKLTAAPASAKP